MKKKKTTAKKTDVKKNKADPVKKNRQYPFFSDEKAATAFKAFSHTVAALRHPETGCPWDLEQDHVSLRKYMIDEAYEAAEVMEKKSNMELCGELGDVLLQVVLNAQLAAEQGTFTLVDVIESIDEKMQRRHPHVFRPEGGKGVSIEQVWQHWKEAKAKEQKKAPKAESLFKDAKKSRFPATTQARKIGEIAANIRFDWQHPKEVLGQLQSEVKEVEEVLVNWASTKKNSPELLEELGDVYFSLAQLCRHVGIDPEVAAMSGNHKFLKRFGSVEKLAREQSIDLPNASLERKEKLWQQAKKKEKSGF